MDHVNLISSHLERACFGEAHIKEVKLFAAHLNGADLMFEASVAGGIPIIRSLRSGLVANRVESLYGILNGTTNYILTHESREEAMQRAVREINALDVVEDPLQLIRMEDL